MNSSVCVDSLFTALNGLKREKSCLEEKLRQTQNKKQLLQHQLKEMTTKYGQVKENNTKMKETLNVAHAKLDKSQIEQKTLQEEVTKERDTLRMLSEGLNAQKERQIHRNEETQNRLAELSLRFSKARKFYDSRLETEAGAVEEMLQKLTTEAGDADSKVAKIASQIQALQLKLDNHTEQESGIKPEIQSLLLGDFKGAHEAMTERNSLLSEKIANVKEEIAQMKSSCV